LAARHHAVHQVGPKVDGSLVAAANLRDAANIRTVIKGNLQGS